MSDKKYPILKEEPILKRNNDAPGFSSSIVRNRNQLLIEMYIQRDNIDIQSYINAQRYLRLDIPIETLREWYPTPNWKKDISKMCRDMQAFKTNIDSPNGDFKYMNLLLNMELDPTGLHLEVNPKALQYFVITNNKFTSLYYNATKCFKISFSHELFWQACKHDISSHNFSFFLTPIEINKTFGTKYQNSNIKSKILVPAQEEIKSAYDRGISPIYITFEERREVIGKAKKIVGWEFHIHNENREKEQDELAIEAYRKIYNFLEKYYNKYHLNVIEQVRTFNSKFILELWIRLEQIEGQMDKIIDLQKYLSKVLIDGFGITPQKRTLPNKDITESPLFSEEEKMNREGSKKWEDCRHYIRNEPSFPMEFKNLIKNEVGVYEYIITDIYSQLTLKCSESVRGTIKILYMEHLMQSICAIFPPKTQLVIKVTK